jgi:hypothetical protein
VKWLVLALISPLALSGQSIVGRVVDVIPLPLRNALVELLPVGGDWITQSTRTDASGTFQFSAFESGEYVILARMGGFQSRVLQVRVASGQKVDAGALELRLSGCDSPGVSCDYFGNPRPRRPPVPVVDLCEALKSSDRFGNKLIVMVGMLTTLHGRPALTATCDSTLASGGPTWINAVLLPEGAAPQQSPTLPKVRDLKKKLVNLAAAVRKTSDSATSRVAAVYGFLDIADALQVIPCAGDSCTHPDIRMPPASFLSVEGFQELK